MLKSNGNGQVVAAQGGVDYQTPMQAWDDAPMPPQELANPGDSDKYARGNHVHQAETSAPSQTPTIPESAFPLVYLPEDNGVPISFPYSQFHVEDFDPENTH